MRNETSESIYNESKSCKELNQGFENKNQDFEFNKKDLKKDLDFNKKNLNQNLNKSEKDSELKDAQNYVRVENKKNKKTNENFLKTETDTNLNCHECREEQQRIFDAELQKKVDEYLLTAQRLQAEFDNYRRKTEVKLQQIRFEGQVEVISKILPCLDSFAGAKKMISEPKTLEGIDMIEKQIISALDVLNVEKIEAVGKKFNPNLHNALAVVCEEKLEDNIVTEEYQAGYKINDKIIRFAQVIVNKKEKSAL